MDLTKITDWPGPKLETGDDKAIPDGLDVEGRIGRGFLRVKPDLNQKAMRFMCGNLC